MSKISMEMKGSSLFIYYVNPTESNRMSPDGLMPAGVLPLNHESYSK